MGFLAFPGALSCLPAAFFSWGQCPHIYFIYFLLLPCVARYQGDVTQIKTVNQVFLKGGGAAPSLADTAATARRPTAPGRSKG